MRSFQDEYIDELEHDGNRKDAAQGAHGEHGGGFAGAIAARALKRADPAISVLLVEASRTFTACPFSNCVIAGMRDLEAQQFGYDKLAAGGVTLVPTSATAVDRRCVAILRTAPIAEI